MSEQEELEQARRQVARWGIYLRPSMLDEFSRDVAALAARPSADAETLRRVRGLLSPNGIPLHDSKVIKVRDLRDALDGLQ